MIYLLKSHLPSPIKIGVPCEFMAFWVSFNGPKATAEPTGITFFFGVETGDTG